MASLTSVKAVLRAVGFENHADVFFWLALKQKEAAPSELHLYPTGGHGYGRCTMPGISRGEVCTWPDRGQLFLQTLGVAPQKQLDAPPPSGDVVEA